MAYLRKTESQKFMKFVIYISDCKVNRSSFQSCIFFLLFSFFFTLFFNCRTIALQCCVGFCHTTMQISHNYTHITSLLSLPPLSSSHTSRSSQSARQGSLCYITTSHQLSLLYMIVYKCQWYFLHLSHSFLPPLCPFSTTVSPFLP